MSRRLLTTVAAACLALATPAFSQAPSADAAVSAPRTFTSLDVFALEFAENPQISPDGRTIAYVRRAADIMTDRYRSEIWSLDVQTGRHRPLVTGSGSYSGPRWSPTGDRLLFSAAEAGASELRILFMDDRSTSTVARPREGAQSPQWSPDGRWIVFTMFTSGESPRFAKPLERPEGAQWAEGARVYDGIDVHMDGRGLLRAGTSQIHIAPADGGAVRRLTTADRDLRAATWLDAETVLAVGNLAEDAHLNPRESEIYAVSVADGAVRPLTARDGPDGSPAVSPDGRLIAYTGYDDRRISWQTTHLYVMDRDGGNVRNLTADFDRAVGSPVWSPEGSAVYVSVQSEGRTEIHRVGLNGARTLVTGDVGSGAGGRPYSGGAYSVARQGRRDIVAYTHGFPDRPAEIAVLPAGGEARILTDLNTDSLGHVQLAAVEEISVPSSVDGRPIQAWIATPPGFTPGGSYPLILEIHGGPNTMYGGDFASEIQRYAAEGFVVVWANPRGSVGYGEEFTLLIDQDFPNHDYTDLMSVVDAVVARGDVDPQRLFVTGGSYGGVLTAWTVGSTDRFAAAASVNPVINWTSLMLAADTATQVSRHLIRELPWENRDAFWRASPLSRVGNVTTPTMLMVGENDWRTPPFEAEQYYTALQLRGVESALVRIPGATHNISARPSHHAVKTDNIIGWFQRHDPARRDAEEEEDGAQ